MRAVGEGPMFVRTYEQRRQWGMIRQWGHSFNNCTLLSYSLGGLGKEGVTKMPSSVREMPFRVENWGSETSSGLEMCGVRVRIEIGH